MDQDLYDQFGNYIGPQIEQQADSSLSQQGRGSAQAQQPDQSSQLATMPLISQHRIVLHEDKKYYPTPEEVYPGAQIMIQQEERQTLDVPIVARQDIKEFDIYQHVPTYYQSNYLLELMQIDSLIRNVCVAGHLHHGKTLLMDLLIQQTHIRTPNWNLQKNYRWLDTRTDEQHKELSIKATSITLLLQDQKDKHYVFNMIDTPGHLDFLGQQAAGYRLSDGVVLIIDALEGCMIGTDRVIQHIIRERLGVVVVINKVDRLILEMKIPPEDAYLKLKYVLEEVNGLFRKHCSLLAVESSNYSISPLSSNVIFASAQYGFTFSLNSMAKKYQEKHPSVNIDTLSRILWGDYYFNHSTHKFTRQMSEGAKRSFVQFVLEPIYKIFSHTVGKDKDKLEVFLATHLNVTLTNQQYKLNVKSLMKLIFQKYFKKHSCLVDSVVKHILPPKGRTQTLLKLHFEGYGNDFYQRAKIGSPTGPLLANGVKMYHRYDLKSFDVLCRVISGTIKTGDALKVLGENYDATEGEDMFLKRAIKLYILQGRYKLEVQSVTAGNWVLIEGIDSACSKTCTIVHAEMDIQAHIMRPLKYWSQAVIRLAIEPLTPSQLPKMQEAIRRACKSYLMLKSKIEQSGQHVLIGNGEMQLDCIMHDIRNLYSDIEIQALAGPLERVITDKIEKQLLSLDDKDKLSTFLQQSCEWDVLASTGIWAFGPTSIGANTLINDTLAGGVTDQNLLTRCRGSVVQGFKWTTREGPLCDEPMRNVKFRLTAAQLSRLPAESPPGQLIPTVRRALYSAFLTASPRLMEPILFTEIQCTTEQCIDAVFAVLTKRRGAVQTQVPKPGTPFYTIRAQLPSIEALGFQTDLRVHTVGQAFSQSMFDHWEVVGGDPLDKRVVLRPLEVLEPYQLAREFMVKTRRRKGLSEDVSILKYFDDNKTRELLRSDNIFKDFL